MKKRILVGLVVCLLFCGTGMYLKAKACNSVDWSVLDHGKIVYHSYSSYEGEDGQLYLYDFDTKKKTCLSEKWEEDEDLHHAMNGHFNHDGTMITFMALSDNGDWDVYLYDMAKKCFTDLTYDNEIDDEDPKFSPDGSRIAFKQEADGGSNIVIYDLKEQEFKTIDSNNSEEKGMPYFSADGTMIYYAKGDGPGMSICKTDFLGRETELFKEAGVQSYYPVVNNLNGQLCFSKWISPKNECDQIVTLNEKTDQLSAFSFNGIDYDTSDICFVTEEYAIVSSTKEPGCGGYDLWLVNLKTGAMANFKDRYPEINDGFEQLGADFSLVYKQFELKEKMI